MSVQTGPQLIQANISHDNWAVTTFSPSQWLSDADDKTGFLISVPRSGTLNKIWFRTEDVITGDTLRVSFQDLNAAGYPDGTADQYRLVTIASVDDNTWFTTGSITSDGSDSGTKRTVTVGQTLGIVFDYATRTAGDMRISLGRNYSSSYSFIGTNITINYETSWVTTGISSMCIALEYTDGVFYTPGCMPAVGSLSTAVSSSTSPDELANIFSVPYPTTIWGLGITCNTLSLRPFDVVLYSSDGSTVLATGSFGSVPNTTGPIVTPIPFTTPYTLSAGTSYYASFRPSGTTNNNIYKNTFPSTVVMGATPFGSSCYGASRTNAGAWTTTPLVQYSIFPIFTGFEDSAGGSVTAYPIEVSQALIVPPYRPVGY